MSIITCTGSLCHCEMMEWWFGKVFLFVWCAAKLPGDSCVKITKKPPRQSRQGKRGSIAESEVFYFFLVICSMHHNGRSWSILFDPLTLRPFGWHQLAHITWCREFLFVRYQWQTYGNTGIGSCSSKFIRVLINF